MATSPEYVRYVLDCLRQAGEISARKMFGDYGLYRDGQFCALLCDDRLFIKPTQAGRAFIGQPVEAAPYPGAKRWFAIDGRLEDSEWLAELLARTCAELPPPRPKRLR